MRVFWWAEQHWGWFPPNTLVRFTNYNFSNPIFRSYDRLCGPTIGDTGYIS
jgi:hypothetical protein